ncbi:hypothetical protein D3C83_256450 [compost metagenome]
MLVGSLIEKTGDNYVPAYYLMLAAAVAIVPLLLIPETARVPIDKVGTESAPRPVGSGARSS